LYTTLFSWILALNIGINFYYEPGEVFIIISLSLLVTELAHFSIRLFINKEGANTFYKGLEPSDVFRMAAALISLSWAAGDSSYFVSVVLMVVIILLSFITIYIVAKDTFPLHSRNKIAFWIGVFLLYILGGWFKSQYVIHHGVKERGHWLEMPKYVAEVTATVSTYKECKSDLITCISSMSSRKEGELSTAKVYITNTTNYDYDDYGEVMQGETYRSIRVLSFTTNDGKTYQFSRYQGYLDDGTTGLIKDNMGTFWHISIGSD